MMSPELVPESERFLPVPTNAGNFASSEALNEWKGEVVGLQVD